VSPVVHTSNISSCQKNVFQFSFGREKFHDGRSFGFLVINVCNHGEHYETPCIILFVIFRKYLLFSRILNIKSKYDNFSANVDISSTNRITKGLLFVLINEVFVYKPQNYG
jgi:hypothetical protein